ncbi:MAG TPA: M36 family metallopeptidase [Candidatus Polarisedimenticolia bacterium]|nr:M36 family metallopeptidase [Candidatus Polarisedimenticolia bacterium]
MTRKTLCGTFRFLPAAATLLAAITASWALKPLDRPLPDFDAAGGLKLHLAPGTLPAAATAAGLERLERESGGKLQVVYNALSRTPRSLAARRPMSAPDAANPAEVARRFVEHHREVWNLAADEVSSLVLDASYTDEHNGMSHAFFTQTVDEIPVFPAVLGVHLNPRGQVVGVQGDLFPGTTRPPRAHLTAGQAAELAADSIGVTLKARKIAEEKGAVIFEAGSLREPVRVEQAIYPLLGAPRLAYRMTLHKNGREWYDLLIDAASGKVLHRRNLFSDTLSPSAPAESSPAAPRARVYPTSPLETVRGTGDLNRRYPYTTDPTGRQRGFANAPLFGADTFPVNSNGGDPKNATLDAVILPLPNAGAPTRSSALPLSTSPQSPQGWFILQGGHYQTIGNNVDAKDDHADDDEATAGHRADGLTTGDFATAQFIYHNYYSQNGPYAAEPPLGVASPERLAGAAPDLDPAVVNLFYITNWYHDFLYHLGFTEAAGNFQKSNFGRGGAENDYLFADAQDGSGTDNANFGTPPDGSNPRMQMFLFSGPTRDGDFDADVIIHEYTHGLSNRLVGGPGNTDCLGVGLVGESGSMGEGWGDWYAATIADEPAVAEYAVDDAAAGIRRFSMNEGPDDFTYGFLCSGPPSNPSLIPCEVHDGGEFWTIVLWEMREAMINRYHNRAFPGGPIFPTFSLPSGQASSNVHNAQGRTTDGSGSVARIDRAAIEDAAFTALFRVTDAMKLAPCNPTMVDMRDAILAADRALGGEFQDLIWRAFANRGIGELATSTGGETGVTVEDFTVPATVASCELLGGPLAAPSFTATAGINSVMLNITPDGAVEYVISRSSRGAGSPADPAPFVEVARITGTSYTDTGLDGGVAYTYRVRALRNDDCVSASRAVGAVPLGVALPCVADPTFGHLSRVVDPGDCRHLLLEWAPASSNCVGGPSVHYNIYRSTTPDFVPGPTNRIATGVAGSGYSDEPGATDRLFYYVVRAEDSTTGHGGPANGGNEDDNTARVAGLVTSAMLVNQGFTDDAETGPDNQRSAHFSSSGLTVPLIPQRGGWFRDGAPGSVAPHSGAFVWHTYNADNVTVSASNNLSYELRSDVAAITPATILTFFHTFQAEGGFDGGVVEAALVDPLTGTVGTFQDLGNLIYEGGYTGELTATSAGTNTNPLFGRRAYTGGVLGPMRRVRAFLGGLVPAGQGSAQVVIRFLFGNDVANTIPPSTPEGNFLPGWYLDDVSLDESCCPQSAPPTSLTAAATGDNQITLAWQPPAGGAPSEYRIFREAMGETTPAVFDEQVAAVPGSQTGYLDHEASAGTRYAYVVRAIPASGCPSSDSNVATAAATGTCTSEPFFVGLRSVSAPSNATCTLDLAWDSGAARCPGAGVRYNVYRSTDPAFLPGEDSLIAAGVTGTTYRDQAGLASGVTYHYIVRAEDTTSSGGGPASGGNEDDNLARRSGSPLGLPAPGPDFSDDLEPISEPGYTFFSTRDAGNWEVQNDPTSHSLTHAWVSLDDQPGVLLTPKDDRLTLPPMSLTSASVLTFYHNFDFAQFPLADPAEAYQSGGVLEISADGSTWIDLGPYITTGGYNGAVDPGSMSPIKGRPAWVGSSDALPGSRADAMSQVAVNLGAAVQAEFGAASLPNARLRFRLGGTFQLLIDGTRGIGWGVDDIHVSSLLSPGQCSSAPPPPACEITSISPGTGEQGQTLGVTLDGSRFASGSGVVFSRDGDSADGVQEGSATVNPGGTRVTLQIDIATDAPEGPHDVSVIAPDGSFCRARSAFVVTHPGGGGATRVIPCDDPSVSRKGGWHDLQDSRSRFGKYCRNVGVRNGGPNSFLELPISSANGGTVSVIYARGPRGGSADASAGGQSRRVDFNRPATDPVHPDSSGRQDLTFGFSETFTVPAGDSVLRIDVRNDDADSKHDMDYVEGFLFTESQSASAQARYSEKASASDATVPAGGTIAMPFTAPAGTILLTAVADGGGADLLLTVRNSLGAAVASSDRALGPEVAWILAIVPGTYRLEVTNHGTTAAPVALYAIPTVDLSLVPAPAPGSGLVPRRGR